MRWSVSLSGESDILPATPASFSAGTSPRAWTRVFGGGFFT
jgi:hypothetical protein